jgi:hypothetical protein
MKMNIKIIFLIFGGIILGLMSWVHALRVEIINSHADILAARKVCLRLLFDPDDQAVYKDTIRFSVDTTQLTLLRWMTSQQHVLQYIPSFKCNKKAYIESVHCEIFIDISKACLSLDGIFLYVACIILKKDGRNVPVNTCVALGMCDQELSLDTVRVTSWEQLHNNFIASNDYSGVLIHNNSGSVRKTGVPVNLLKEENKTLDELLTLWRRALASFRAVTHTSWYLHGYLFLLCLLLLLYLKKRFYFLRYVIWIYGAWEKELRRFLLFLWMSLTIGLFSLWIPEYIVLGMLAVFFVPLTFYYISAGQETFLGRLKSLIGFILGASIIPLLVKAFLIKNAVMFTAFFK